MLTLEGLKSYGANTEEGMARCMNNEAFYLRMVGMMAEDRHAEALEEAIGKGDLQAAFEAAHALKGTLQRPLLPANAQGDVLFLPPDREGRGAAHGKPGALRHGGGAEMEFLLSGHVTPLIHSQKS